jgi:flagellar biosynthesis protein
VNDDPKPPLAVALSYQKPNAPRVVAKGRGEIGQAIIDTARANGVPLEHNPALAEALSQVELDDAIPEDLYRAVATVIGFVLRASGQIARPPTSKRPLPPR